MQGMHPELGFCAEPNHPWTLARGPISRTRPLQKDGDADGITIAVGGKESEAVRDSAEKDSLVLDRWGASALPALLQLTAAKLVEGLGRSCPARRRLAVMVAASRAPRGQNDGAV